MTKRTKKVGPAGRLGSRYGVRARTRIRNVEQQQRLKHICTNCGHRSVRRKSTSIWECRKCGNKFAGGAYIPKTDSGINLDKILRGESKTSEIYEEKEDLKEE
jgi:large subunit ribosomal protein L37Ae